MNVREAVDRYSHLLEVKKVESPRLSAEVLTAHVMNLSRADLFTHGERILTRSEESQLRIAIDRRMKHEPVPYIIKEVEFYSIPLTITNGVLIPRPETETLVDVALEFTDEMPDPPKIYDLGTGSGNIVIALAMNLEDGEFWASDISSTAIRVATRNVQKHELNLRVELREGSLFTPLRNELNVGFDMIVSNPPYIKTNEIAKLPPQIRDFEPVAALDGGRDGLTMINTILDGANPVLKPGGYVLLEIEPSLVTPLIGEVERRERNYEWCEVHKDLSGKDRVVSIRKKEF